MMSGECQDQELAFTLRATLNDTRAISCWVLMTLCCLATLNMSRSVPAQISSSSLTWISVTGRKWPGRPDASKHLTQFQWLAARRRQLRHCGHIVHGKVALMSSLSHPTMKHTSKVR